MEYIRPFSLNALLRILEPSEGVTVAILPTAQALFKGRGEQVPIYDEETEKEPQIGNTEEENYLKKLLQTSNQRGRWDLSGGVQPLHKIWISY